MNFSIIAEKKAYLQANKHLLSKEILANYQNNFNIEYTHNSTAIEGNTLSLMETKLVLEDKVSVGGKALREIYEVINHHQAYSYVNACIAQNKPLNEEVTKEIHQILMANIMPGGIYRNVDVYISGSKHEPPSPQEGYKQVKNFYLDLSLKTKYNPIEMAAWTHGEFVKIHPFVDGNGRTSRLLMNYQLLQAGFLPISIAKEDKLQYFASLEDYALNQNLIPFTNLIYKAEEKQLNLYLKAIEQSKELNL